LLETLPPDRALRAWLDRYAGFVASKRGIIDTLRAGWASGRITTPTIREGITATLETFLAAGSRAGSLRADLCPDDVTALVLAAAARSAPPRSSGRYRGEIGPLRARTINWFLGVLIAGAVSGRNRPALHPDDQLVPLGADHRGGWVV
jgi:hypothetical protein